MPCRRPGAGRHGQGAHNASIKNWKLIDPPLNEVGLAQAAKLCETLKAGDVLVEIDGAGPMSEVSSLVRDAVNGRTEG